MQRLLFKKMASTTKLQRLRGLMKAPKYDLAAYVVPTDDPHASEYIAPFHGRREYISGFTGSAGTAVVTLEKALLWTDGRYWLQASQQLDENWELVKDRLPTTPPIRTWLANNLPKGSKVGIDPSVFSQSSFLETQNALSASGITLTPTEENLIDQIWENRPNPPLNQIISHPLKFSGQSTSEKFALVREQMVKLNAIAHCVTALDSIAWLLNIRGNDIPFNPVVISYVIVLEKKVLFYVDNRKLTPEVISHLGEEVEVRPYENIFNDLKEISEKGNVWIDSSSSQAIYSAINPNHVVIETSPIPLAKAIKNPVELKGMKDCHIRDAAALIRFFSWLEIELNQHKVHTEYSVSAVLAEFRSKQPDFFSLSFETIAGSGKNGAIIHYKPEKENSAEVSIDKVFLCDSGGQYKDGTTDVTRTLHFGNPTPHEIECYTRVLKGHINLGLAIFPDKINGHQLDILARIPLWNLGLDYAHGTGHGIGAFLNVHEGPHGISFRPNKETLKEGMLVTNEPGYYEQGNFGIRIENVMAVITVQPKHKSADKYLGFEHITLVPYCRKLIDIASLERAEIEFVNKYHRECLEKVGPLLDGDSLKWLQRECEPL
eukprot:TRINITY_DN2136_c0_g2_i1.p1 TRINITY_DN2136_c0_g2~~TRINITY_DN2136_c0_g2_i1.p1  ORF type:complete len:603 (+),score=137.06 TRINITY_DN2136_c0_g2_i1:50-1858(+)